MVRAGCSLCSSIETTLQMLWASFTWDLMLSSDMMDAPVTLA